MKMMVTARKMKTRMPPSDFPVAGGSVALINCQFRLAARPVGLVKRSDFDFTEAPARAPGENEVLVKALQLSLDPAMRGWMNEGKSYVPPVQIGEVMRAGGVGKVIDSNHPKFKVGDYVNGTLGIQEYATLDEIGRAHV